MARYISYATPWLAIVSSALAATPIDSHSLGHAGNLSPDGQKIPNWSLATLGHGGQILSDRVVLTPPFVDNARGALWNEHPMESEEWTAELDFRANGQDMGSGNIQYWYVQNKDSVGTNSVYTVGQFDGLAIIVNQYGGRGSIRGFLNDGTQNFNSMSNLDSLAFGHCEYNYRNLGRPSKLRINSGHYGLIVTVDDQNCFATHEVNLPKGYYFGTTATTAEHPDNFEIFKILVDHSAVTFPERDYSHHEQENVARSEQLSKMPDAPEVVPDREAGDFRSNDAQFEDLHNRLQSLQHQLLDMTSVFEALGRKIDTKSGEIMGNMPKLPQDALNSMNRRLENTERIVQQIQRDVEGRDYQEHLTEMKEAMHSIRGGLTDVLPKAVNHSKWEPAFDIVRSHH